jgi:tetratricopeptide (TPR) repeat protein
MKKMKTLLRFLLLLGLFFTPLCTLQAQQAQPKYALVIGNGAYTNITRLPKLNNPANDANDMASALQELGFQVDKVIDGDRVAMQDAVERLKNRLSTDSNAYGFFFYAGHGVQSERENYLIPVDADIPSESYLGNRALPLQVVLGELNRAANTLNVVVLDACRDTFSWNRGGLRGLAPVSSPSANSIIFYATAAGGLASEGTDRNGLFTGELLKHIKEKIEIREVFRRTMKDVVEISNQRKSPQKPTVSDQFSGAFYLAGAPPEPPVNPRPDVSDEAYFNRGKEYCEKCDYDHAIENFNEAIKLNQKKDAITYNKRGTMYAAKGESDLAIKDFNKAIELDQDYAEAYRNRGSVYMYDDYDLAIEDFNKAIKLDQNDDAAYNNRGIVLAFQAKFDLAIKDFTKVIELISNNAAAYYNRGMVYTDVESDLAIKDFNKAIELDQDYAEAYRCRGRIFYDKEDWNHAVKDFTKYLELEPHGVMSSYVEDLLEKAKEKRG